jgi:hypothetical protein
MSSGNPNAVDYIYLLDLFYIHKMAITCFLFKTSVATSFILLFFVVRFKGTVQRDRFDWKWYQSKDLSLNVRRRDFQLILTAHSRVRGPLSFRATSYEYLQLSRQVPITGQTSCSALFLTPFCYSQLC